MGDILRIRGSHGKITADRHTGKVLTCGSAEYADIFRIDVAELLLIYGDLFATQDNYDIIWVSFWTKDGGYIESDSVRREHIQMWDEDPDFEDNDWTKADRAYVASIPVQQSLVTYETATAACAVWEWFLDNRSEMIFGAVTTREICVMLGGWCNRIYERMGIEVTDGLAFDRDIIPAVMQYVDFQHPHRIADKWQEIADVICR